MNATLQAWDAAVKAWWKWQVAFRGVAQEKMLSAAWSPFLRAVHLPHDIPEGQAYVSAMLKIPHDWRTPNAVALGD